MSQNKVHKLIENIQALIEKPGKNKEVIFYLLWICFFLLYSHLILRYSFSELMEKEWTQINDKSENISLYMTMFFLLMLFLYFNRFFTRQDGYFFLPGQDTYIVSRSDFYERYYVFIQVILSLLIWMSTFVYIGAEDCSRWFWSSVAFISFSVIVLSFKIIESKIWIVHLHNFLVIFISLIILKSVVDDSKNVSLNLLIIIAAVFLFIGLYSLIINREHLIKFLITTSKGWIFSEFLAADQSKKNAENISLLNYLINKNNPNEEDSINFINDITGKHDKIFLRSYNPVQNNLESDFLHLKHKKDFDIFINKSLDNNKLKKKYEKLLQEIKKAYMEAEDDFTELLMEARTENIKKRNTNNLKVSLGLLIISDFTIFLYYEDRIIHLTLYFFICLVFLRLLLRSLEIVRAFYIDFTYSSYPKSFLSGSDRIYLAIKSVIEISLLASSIYLLHQSLSKEWVFNIFDIIRTTAYALSVSIFNISFPESSSFSHDKGLLFLLTHLIQVILSIVLITMSITSYMSRTKNISYFRFVEKENELLILKIYKNHPVNPECVLKVDSSLIKDEKMPDDLMKSVQLALQDKKISHDELDYIIYLLNDKFFDD